MLLCDIGLVDSLKKQIAFISWFRLEFEDVEMGGPAMGDCQNDTMMVQNKMILFLQFNERIEAHIYLIDAKPRWLEWTRSLQKLSQAPSVEHSLDNTVSIDQILYYDIVFSSSLSLPSSSSSPSPNTNDLSPVILTVKDQAQPGAKLIFNHASGSAKWRVRVRKSFENL